MDVSPIVFAALVLAAAIFLAAVIRAFGEPPNPIGRYQFHVAVDGMVRILDTKTGTLWERASASAKWIPAETPWIKSNPRIRE